jgi:transcriptional regulator with XRE-family HTH domain
MVAAGLNPVPERVYPGIRNTRLSFRRLSILVRMAVSEVVTERRPTPLNGNGSSESRRRELGSFLRSRRERIRPEQVGLPRSRRRRTPGLRREEVAQLAGVGITWYTWLEQGRKINASPQVLDAIARTLRFDAHEHEHLFTLAGVPTAVPPDDCEELSEAIQLLLDRLEPHPALVLNARWDLLAYNRVQESFIGSYEDIRPEDRNCLWLAFTDERWRRMMFDWEEAVHFIVAEYRSAMAEHIDDPAWQALVDRLHRVSPEFTEIWERHDVVGQQQSRTKRVMHPTAGLLRLDYTNLWLDRPGTRIVAFTPADEDTERRLLDVHASL